VRSEKLTDTGKNQDPRELKRSVLLVSTFAAFLTPFMGSSVNLALPAIGKELNANAIQMSWIISSFILSSAIFLLPMGRLADQTGRKKIFLYGLILFTISTSAILFVNNITLMLTLRVIQGISSAMIFGTSLAIITSVFPAGERGRAMGINITAVYLGLSSGPVIGGFLTETLGWRTIFGFLIPIGLVSVYLVIRKIRTEWSEGHSKNFDWKGSLIYGSSLFASMYGFSKLPSASGWISLVTGLTLAAVFILFEKKTENPVFDLSLILRNRVFAFSGLAALINYSATSAVGFFISLYLQYVKGLDARTAGLIMISQPLAMALLSPLAGKLSDRKDPGIIASAGMGFTAAGLILLCLVNEKTPLYFIVILFVLLGIGFGLFSSPNSNAIMSSVDRKHYGTASGVVGTMRMVGQMMSMGIATMLVALFIGRQTINPSTIPGLLSAMKSGFIIFSVLSVCGIFASLARNNKSGLSPIRS
jgi:EmrB/QacA subfamily drug resistance transporter